MRRALLVRSHNPTEDTLARIAAWIRSLNSFSELDMELWFSVDTTTLTPEKRRAEPPVMAAKSFCGRKRRRVESRGATRNIVAGLLEHGLQAGTNYHIHTYCEADLVSEYPVLEELRHISPVNSCRELTSGACSLAWGFHGEVSRCAHSERHAAYSLYLYYAGTQFMVSKPPCQCSI